MNIELIIETLSGHHGVSAKDATALLYQTCIDAAHEVLDPRLKLEMDLDPPQGHQWPPLIVCFEIVETILDPWTQIALADAHQDPDLKDLTLGDEVLLVLSHRNDRIDDTTASILSSTVLADFDHARAKALRRGLHCAIATLLTALPPWSDYGPGTLGQLLAMRGSWLLGLRAKSKGLTLTIDSVHVSLPTFLHHNAPKYTLCAVLRVEQGGTESVYEAELSGSMVSMQRWLDHSVSPVSEAGVRSVLAETAERLASPELRKRLRSDDVIHEILTAALSPISSTCLMTWCKTALKALICDNPISFEVDGHHITLDFDGMPFIAKGLGSRGQGWANVVLRQEGPNLDEYSNHNHLKLPELAIDESSIYIGQLTKAALTLPAPDDVQRGHIEAMLKRWRDHVEGFLRHYMVTHPNITPNWAYFQWTYAPPPNLLGAIEHLIAHGPPGPPPVPRFDEQAIERAAQTLHTPTKAERAAFMTHFRGSDDLIGTFRIAGRYTVGLMANRTRWAHAESAIFLTEDGSDELIQLLLTDVWSPQSRVCLDGDTFAFKRFTEWLAAGIERAGIDESVEFSLLDDPDGEYNEDDKDAPRKLVPMTLSAWLSFDLPPFGDDFVLDWRCTHYAARRGGTLASMAGIYGFKKETLDKFIDHRVVWRRFLAEVIDPRFDGYDLP